MTGPVGYHPRPHAEFTWARIPQPDMPQAACQEHRDLPWIPDADDGPMTRQLQAMRAVCRNCPELEPCREFALAQYRIVGFWGGLSARERRTIREAR